MSLNGLTSAVTNTLISQIPDIAGRSIKEHAGQFTASAIANEKFSSQAIFIGCLGAKDDRGNALDVALLQSEYGSSIYATRMIAVCVAKHASARTQSNALARDSAETVMQLLHRQDWNLNYVTPAFNRSCEPMLTATVDNSRLSFWRVQWWHYIALNSDVPFNLEDFDGWDGDTILPELTPATVDLQTDPPVMSTQVDHD